jgi:hypothetical protein
LQVEPEPGLVGTGQDASLLVGEHDEDDFGMMVLGLHQFLQARDIISDDPPRGGSGQHLGQGGRRLDLPVQQHRALADGQIHNEQGHHDGMHCRDADDQAAAERSEQEPGQCFHHG